MLSKLLQLFELPKIGFILPVFLLMINASHLFAQSAGTLNQSKLEQFEDAILKGEDFLKKQDYPNAKAHYKKALEIDPTAKYPKDKLAIIRKFYTDPADEQCFDQAMKSGDVAFAAGKFDEAGSQYEIALNVKPDDKEARDKLSSAREKDQISKEALKNYNNNIQSADKLYTAGDMAGARLKYQAAADAMPGQTYALSRIKEIDSKAVADKTLRENYEKALAEGDEAYMNRDFTSAKLKYEYAQSLKPGENYPKSMLERVAQGMAEMKDQKASYNAIIAGADKLFASDSYHEAAQAYQSALKLFPAESYPKAQLDKINGLLRQKRQLDEEYESIVTNADKLLNNKQLSEAKLEYQRANNLKPEEAYPKQKIEEIAAMLLALKEEDRIKAYQKSIQEADELARNNNIETALEKYQDAIQIKNDESYPRQRIDELNKMLETQKEQRMAYNKALAEGDAKYGEKKYEEAITLYQKALTFVPGEPYPQQQIKTAQQAIDANHKNEDSYSKLIANADKLYNDGELEPAMENYNAALSIKPGNEYPKAQIEKINDLLKKLRQDDEQYQKYLTEADLQFGNNQYDAARVSYQKASAIKPDEPYIKQKLSEIDKANKEIAQNKAAYQSFVTQADNSFKSGELTGAAENYRKALLILPGETYPQQKLNEIEQLIANRKSLEENYNNYIEQGNQLALENKTVEAIPAYRKALNLKPDEKYPAEQIDLLNAIIAKQKSIDDSYTAVVTKADELFKAGNYTEATKSYKEAASIKPSELYPAQQISKIESIVKMQKDAAENYLRLIAQADKEAVANDLEKAIFTYQQASQIKPDELYPREQIQKLNDKISAKASSDKAYNEAIAEADGKFANAEYSPALEAYQLAASIQPESVYASDQIKITEYKIAEASLQEQKYQQLIVDGDAFFAASELEKGRTAYNAALTIKPGQTYPAQKIAEIDAMLEKQRSITDQEYNDKIASADRLFNLKDYTSAIKDYEKATALKPAENYPKDKLLEINTILMERSRNQLEAYNKLILNADQFYQQKIYDQAIDAYAEAQLARPDEAYPREMIIKIRKYMEDHAMVNLISEPVVISRDTEKKIKFSPIDIRLRKNNYIILKARKTAEPEPKVYLNYGADGQKNGGIVLKSIRSEETGDYMVRVSMQDRWYRYDNNWISIYAEGADVEISSMQIAQGD